MKRKKHLWGLLFTKEIRYLAGYRASNLITLFGISFLSLAAIGIAYSSETFLNYRMNDPFTNWLNIPKLSTIEDQTWQDLVRFLEDDQSMREEYGIASVSRNFNSTLSFFNNKLGKGPLLYGETFHPVSDSLILLRINGDEPVDHDLYNSGIILSESGLNKLGYEWEDRDKVSSVFVYRTSAETDRRYIAVPLKVLRVVSMLPDRREFIIHPELNFKLEKSARRSHLYSEENGAFGFRMLVVNEPGKADSVIAAMGAVPGIRSVEQDGAQEFAPFTSIRVETDDKLDYAARFNSVEHLLGLDREFPGLILLMNENEFFWRAYSDAREERYHQNYIVNFSNLQSIRKFSDAMMENFGYPVDLATVEAKENFSLTSITTLILVFCLLLFAGLSILIFLRSMLKAHLEKIAPNLGTMLAFGIDPRRLQRNYVLISGVMVAFVLFLSLLFLLVFSGAITNMLISFLDIEGADMRVLTFQPINSWTLLTCALVLMGAIGITRMVGRKILSNPPSDLIYGRI